MGIEHKAGKITFIELEKEKQSHKESLKSFHFSVFCLFRSCTDVLCCLIFVIVILLYVALGVVGKSTHKH